MNEAMGTVMLIATVVGLPAYIAWSYYRAATHPTRRFGLPPGEAATHMWIGEVERWERPAPRVAHDDLALQDSLFDALYRVSRTQRRACVVFLTSAGRLGLELALDASGERVERMYFASRAELDVRYAGPGDRYLQGGPSVRLDLAGAFGSMRVVVHESARAYLGV